MTLIILVKVHNKAVGKDLQDHPAVGLIIALDPAVAAGYPNSYNVASQWADYILAVEGYINTTKEVRVHHFYF